MAGGICLILNIYFWDWPVEVAAVMFGIFHGLGGASVATNLSLMAYIGDVAGKDTKVNFLFAP